MARSSGDSLKGAHWWQRRPMVALLVGWTVIGSLALAAFLHWGPRLPAPA